MEATDRLIRGLYALAVEEDWARYRAIALERACREVGANVGAWLTHVCDPLQNGEFTAWPAEAPVAVKRRVQPCRSPRDQPPKNVAP